jgi:hypothetical protein
MITYKNFLTEGSLSSYEYTLPGNLEEEFYDFYVWVYFYHMLEGNHPHVGEDTLQNIRSIVLNALETIIPKNIETMRDAMLLSTSVEFGATDNNQQSANRYQAGFSDLPRIRKILTEKFGGDVEFLERAKSQSKKDGNQMWSNICSGILTLYEKDTDLDVNILKLDHIYDLRHCSGAVVDQNRFTDMTWINQALDFKFKDKQFAIASKGSVPEYVTAYILNQLGDEKTKRNRRLTDQETEIHDQHSDAYILFLKTIQTGRRNPSMEEVIKQEPEVAFEYAMHVLKGKRWPEAEPYILENIKTALIYATKIIHGRWPELEKVILNKKNLGAVVIYARDVIKGRWPEGEAILFGSTNQKYIDIYKEMFHI